ncbi:MAG: hypothetical protein ACKPKO_10580, partial [Candidatus Fonsibacter sp.]
SEDMHIMPLARVIHSALFKFVCEGLQEDTLVSLNQVLIGILDLFPQLINDQIAIFNGILHKEAHWRVLESVIGPMLKFVLSECKWAIKGFTHMLISCAIASSLTLSIM